MDSCIFITVSDKHSDLMTNNWLNITLQSMKNTKKNYTAKYHV